MRTIDWRQGGTRIRAFSCCIAVVVASILGVFGQPAKGLMTPGITVPASVRASLTAKLELFGKELKELREGLAEENAELLPDVEIFYRAVDVALRFDEFHRESEFQAADALLDTGRDRAASLRGGQAPWTEATGLVVRGYRSHLDDSVQPYGLVVPPSYAFRGNQRFRTDVWLHGRDNRLTELKFLDQRQRSAGRFTPSDTLVLHPYGRFCNAFKFAGEVDVFEALAAVKRHYAVDESRVAIRGFSMGGAGCWHLAVHYPDVWVAAAPGAGFAESADYLGLWRKERKPTWYEQALWHYYDATDYAQNLVHVPTVAYSGGADKQIQAAEVMERALAAEGMRLRHVIGPETGHSYHPDAKEEVARRVNAVVRRGKDPVPQSVSFTTWTLRYARSHWVQLEQLGEHWKRARIKASIEGTETIVVESENVTALVLAFDAGESPFPAGTRPRVRLGDSVLQGPAVATDRSWRVDLIHTDGRWGFAESSLSLGKRPGLQGPMDDVFMDRFIIVEPSSPLPATRAGRWIQNELDRLKREWRAQFRGDPLVVRADRLTDQQLSEAHLVAFGDPTTNEVLARIASELPVAWEADRVSLGRESWDANSVVPLLIYPNPLNTKKYIVINSGFTFRGFGSNATQVPRLPDFALVSTDVPADAEEPGKVLKAGFFNEQWGLE